MNFKFDKDTVLIVLVGCLLMGGWLIYMPKYQAKRAAENILAEANADAQAIRDKAARDSKDAITDIALEISGKLMGRAVTDADNRRIVDSFFAE